MCPTGSSTYGYVIHHNVGGVACDTCFNNYQSNRTPRRSRKSLGGAHTQNIIKSNRTQHVQSLEVAYSISQWICELKLQLRLQVTKQAPSEMFKYGSDSNWICTWPIPPPHAACFFRNAYALLPFLWSRWKSLECGTKNWIHIPR